MKINLKFLLKSKNRGIVPIPHYIFLLVLLLVGYSVLFFILYAVFNISLIATGREFTRPNYLFPLLFLIISLLSFFTINNNLRVKANGLRRIGIWLVLIIIIVIGLFNTEVSKILGISAKNDSTVFSLPTQTITLPTVEPTPTSTPTTTPKLQKNTYVAPTIDPDPVMSCHGAKGGACENQMVRVRKSTCMSGVLVCCQLPNEWKILTKENCTFLHQKRTEFEKAIAEQNQTKIEQLRKEIESLQKQPSIDTSTSSNQSSSQWDELNRIVEEFRQSLSSSEEFRNSLNNIVEGRNQAEKQKLYDMCVEIVNDKYSDNSGGITGQSGGVSGGVYYGTENRAYQDELSGCNILLK